MSAELEIDDAVLQIRSKLQVDNVKLWVLPYFAEKSGSCEEEIKNLAKNYSESLSIPYELCYTVLIDLQKNALEKLKERDLFKETGIATLKIRISQENSGVKVLKIEQRLSSLGVDLKNEVTLRTDIPSNRLKLIANGKVVPDDQSLQDLGIKNGTVIMVVILHDNPNEIQNTGNQMKELQSIKDDTKLLASNNDQFYMEVEDQSGNVINLPLHERKALMVAMALHEKGRNALKKEDYSTALVMFLDADKEFCQCNSAILETVDNYALLNLDIVWCYLCLKSISQVPEAEERLRKCEQSFHKSYGPNMERLMTLKGTTGNEAALFMRLHLLQAIIKYHQNQRDEALQLLLRAEEEWKVLRVDENSIMALVELGYSPAEARLGLRTTFGHVDAAAEYINKNREQRTQSRKKALEEMILNKERRKLGFCADGKQYVEPKFVKTLTGMGYSKETARLALQQSNNNISMSIQIIQDNPQMLEVAASSSSESINHIVKDMVPMLEGLGFDIRMVTLALKKHKGDPIAAIEDLLAHEGIIEGISLEDEEAQPGNSRQQSKAEKAKKELEALGRLTTAIPMVDDDHLDLSLDQEEIFLNQYKSLLKRE